MRVEQEVTTILPLLHLDKRREREGSNTLRLPWQLMVAQSPNLHQRDQRWQ